MGGNWSVEDGEDDGGEVTDTTYGVDDALPGVPTSGLFIPSALSGGNVEATADGTTIALNDGGYFELSDGTRYTCTSADGCTVANGTVTAGTMTGPAADTGEVDRFPSFRGATNPGDQTYTVGTTIGTLALPEATGGNGGLNYSLSPDVPGLSFNATARQLTGTPSTADTYAMTYTVTDEDGDTDTLGFTITVSAETSTGGSLGDCNVGLTVSSGESCTYPGTTDAFSVNVRGRGLFLTFLAGIRIRINNQTIDGRVYDFEASHQGDGVWRIDRIAGSTEVPTGGGLETGGDTSPALGSGPGNQTYTVGIAIGTLTLSAATGGDGTLTYTLTPEVPGLSFNATTRQLAGTPSAADTYAMTYTVTDEDGDTDSLTFVITVEGEVVPGSPDLVVEFSVSDATRVTETTLRLLARPRNQGGGPASISTTLRYYRSADASISTADSEVSTREIDVRVGHSYSLRTYTPSSAGMYYYGACVDAVDGESDTTNNCSPGVLVTVTQAETGFDLHEDNGRPGGIAYADGRLYVLDYDDEKVYVYEVSGQRVPGSDFDLDEDNGSPRGIAYADGRLYVLDYDDEKVYVYEASGQRVPGSDFDLDGDNGDPVGIAYADGRLYVLDYDDEKVFAYEASGQRVPGADFDLNLEGEYIHDGFDLIAYANGRFYVVIDGDNVKFNRYEASGQRDPDSDFDSENNSIEGIAYADGSFYVVDPRVTRVFEYPEPGGGGDRTEYGVGDAIATLPTGSWFPDVTRGSVAFRIVGGVPAIDFGNGGYIEEGSNRYTCASAGGCQLRGQEVRAGTIVQTPSGVAPEEIPPTSGTAGTCEVALGRSAGAGGTETVSVALSDALETDVGTLADRVVVSARMDDASDFDVYKIVLSDAGTLVVLSGGALDTQAVFLRSDCTEEAHRVANDAGQVEGFEQRGLNFAVAGHLGAGTYYIVVFEWAGRTGNYTLEFGFASAEVGNDTPVIEPVAHQEVAPGGTATVDVEVTDDTGDAHTIVAISDNDDVATVDLRGSGSSRSLVIDRRGRRNRHRYPAGRGPGGRGRLTGHLRRRREVANAGGARARTGIQRRRPSR